MNKRQLVALWAAIGPIVLMGLFPPWVKTSANLDITLDMTSDYRSHQSSGYRWYSVNPTGYYFIGGAEWRHGDLTRVVRHAGYPGASLCVSLCQDASFSIDRTRLFVQWGVVAVLGGGMILTLRTRKRG